MTALLRTSLGLLACAALLHGCTGDQPFDPGAGEADPSFARATASGLIAPSNASASGASGSQIDLGWQDNSSNESRFEIHRSSGGPAGTYSLVATTGSNSTSYRDWGLQSAAQYCYKVRAVRATGKNVTFSPFSNAACATTTAADQSLPAPVNLSVADYTPTRIDIRWQDRSSEETGFEVFHADAGSEATYVFLGSVAQNGTTFSHAGLIAGTNHCYKVRAVRVTATSSVASAFSNIVCAPTFPAPAYDTRVLPSGGGNIIIYWTAIGLYFRIEKSTDAGATWSVAGTVYNDRVFSTAAESEQLTCLRVINYNDSGEAAPSNIACAIPPAAPSALAVTAVDAETLELTWRDNSGVEDGYEVWFMSDQWSCTGEHSGVYNYEERVAVLPANSTSHRVSGMLGGDVCAVTSWYEVRAMKDGSYTSTTVIIDP